MKTIIKLPECLLFLMIIFLFSSGSPVLANDHFDTNRYDVNITIGSDAKCVVREKISLFFNHKQNNIRRTLTTDRGVHRMVNGKDVVENEHVVYSAFASSGKEIHTKTNNKQLTVYIFGEAPVSGYQNVSLSYTRDAGDNGYDDFDDLTLPILPNTWDDTINEADFKITLPKTIDPKSVTLYAGEYGAKNGTGLSYTINDKIITGHLTQDLKPCEGVTLYLRVDKGYFQGAATGRDFLIPDALIAIAAFTATFILVFRFLKGWENVSESSKSDTAPSLLSRHDYRAQPAYRLRSVIILMILLTSLFHAWAMMFAALRSISPAIGLIIWLFAALMPTVADILAFYLFFKLKGSGISFFWFAVFTIAAVMINIGAIIFCFTIIHNALIPAAVYSGLLAMAFACAFFSNNLRSFRKKEY